MQSTAGAYGHVAYVENVNSNGSITVSEMNYGHGVGVVTVSYTHLTLPTKA